MGRNSLVWPFCLGCHLDQNGWLFFLLLKSNHGSSPYCLRALFWTKMCDLFQVIGVPAFWSYYNTTNPLSRLTFGLCFSWRPKKLTVVVYLEDKFGINVSSSLCRRRKIIVLDTCIWSNCFIIQICFLKTQTTICRIESTRVDQLHSSHHFGQGSKMLGDHYMKCCETRTWNYLYCGKRFWFVNKS